MKRILVIADDLTGAAEIAGIGHRFGLSTSIAREVPVIPDSGLTVIDTDSRLMSSDDAVKRIGELLHHLPLNEFHFIYKKTDSVLRGNIVFEIDELLRLLGRDTSVFIPQNPSRGRTIKAGHYYIDDVPLDETSFADDADRPATTADVIPLLRHGDSSQLHSDCATNDVMSPGINIANAASVSDLSLWAKRITSSHLAAGGADFFKACLENNDLREQSNLPVAQLSGTKLFLCGTASAARFKLVETARALGAAVCPMPDGVFARDTASLMDWTEIIVSAVQKSGTAVVYIPQPLTRNAEQQAFLLTALVYILTSCMTRFSISNLFLEGGATASAICKRMRWNDLQIIGELAPGVVVLNPNDEQVSRIIVKPGSYPWPDSIWARG